SDFEPKLDSTVRVQVARLRAKLKEFHETAGDDFPLRLSLPLGRHELEWTYRPARKSIASRLSVIPKPYRWTVGLIMGVLLVACAALVVEVRSLKAALPAPPAPLPRFWQSFLVPGKSTMIVVPSPLYFFWPSHQVYVRDLQISDFSNWQASPTIKE